MRVTIETDNGHMEVDLEEFFPTSLARVRKLFRLLQSGADGITLRNVRSYLAGMGPRAKNSKADTELQIRTSERELEMLKRRRNELERDIRSAKEKLRREEQIERSAKVWIRDFDYICGVEEEWHDERKNS